MSWVQVDYDDGFVVNERVTVAAVRRWRSNPRVLRVRRGDLVLASRGEDAKLLPPHKPHPTIGAWVLESPASF